MIFLKLHEIFLILWLVGQVSHCPTVLAYIVIRSSKLSLTSQKITQLDNNPGSNDSTPSLESELEHLQQQLQYIKALEERNLAQLESFVDEQDQWDSLEESERQLMSSKASIEIRIEELLSDLVNDWMGQKSMDG